MTPTSPRSSAAWPWSSSTSRRSPNPTLPPNAAGSGVADEVREVCLREDHEPAPCEDWTRLVGCLVEVRLSRQRVAAGTVDVVSSEGDLIWIEAQSADTRKLYDKLSGYEIWIQKVSDLAHPMASSAAATGRRHGPFLDINSAWPDQRPPLAGLAGQRYENTT